MSDIVLETSSLLKHPAKSCVISISSNNMSFCNYSSSSSIAITASKGTELQEIL